MSVGGRQVDADLNDGGRQAKADASAHAVSLQPHDDHAQQQRRQGADVAHTTRAPALVPFDTAHGRSSGAVARPAYNQQLTYQTRVPTTPVVPTHGPDSRPHVRVALPADFAQCNPTIAVNQLRSVIDPAQAAAIDAACAAQDVPRARELLRELFATIAAHVNAAGDAAALALLQQAGRAAHTLAAVKLYFAVAQRLRMLETAITQAPPQPAPRGSRRTQSQPSNEVRP